jgi:hypothetical protein
MKYRYLFGWIWWLMVAAVAQGQEVRLSATASQQRILIGEQLQLTLQAKLPANRTVDWFQLDSFPHFEILHRSAIDTQRSDNTITLVQNIQLTSWDSGRWSIPALSLRRSNRTNPIVIDVGYLPLAPEQKYNEVKDVLDVQQGSRTTWYWYLIGAGLLLLLVFLLFPGKKKKEDEGRPASETAYRDALKNLDALEKRAESADSKIFYTDLIQVFRAYLALRKGFYSLSKTTGDISAQLPAWGLGAERAAQLSDTLQLSDGVKFARFEASAADRKASLKAVRESIVFMEKQAAAAGNAKPAAKEVAGSTTTP